MKKLYLILPLVLCLCFVFGCQQQESEEVAEEPVVDVETEKASIQAIFDKYAEAWKLSSIDHFSEIFSQNVDTVIIDTQKKYVGWEAWKERIQNSFDSISDVNVTFRDFSIKVHPSGTIAWLSCLEDATWISQDQPDEVKGMRVTWVMEKKEGKWVIVQGHWSVSEQQEEE